MTAARVTLTLTDEHFRALRGAACDVLETAGVLLVAPVVADGGGTRLLLREIHWVPEGAYLRRESDGLTISSDGYVAVLARAETIGAIPLWLHTHPGDGSSPVPSRYDERVDEELAEAFSIRSGSPHYGSLVVSPAGATLAFTGRFGAPSALDGRIDSLHVAAGQVIRAFDAPEGSAAARYERNIKAFGGAVQETLGQLSVAVVGAGGTGSAVAEQLARLGVGRILVIDPKRLSDSNITRVYGSTPSHIGQPKADVLAEHLRHINPAAHITSHVGSVTELAAARLLRDVDVVFGCTDDNAGRLVLSRLATYYLTTVIDCGVLLTAEDDGTIRGIDARVTVLRPGQACLLCRRRVDPRMAAAEMTPTDERERLQAEGYAPALPGVEPAVVTFTTAVAAAAVNELLESLIQYGPQERPSEVLLRMHEREISTNSAAPNPGHYCDPAQGRIGLGDTEPLMEMLWGS